MVSPQTAFLVGLVGTGTTESLSPALHMAEAKAQGLSHVFRPIDISALDLTVDQLPEILDWSERLGYNAMTVTHPCKQQVLQHLDRVDPVAAQLGAVNTVVYTAEGRIGYNTDTTGFESAFRARMPGATLDTVVQLGAGGAGTAVADALVRIGARRLILVDIDPARAAALAADLRARHDVDAGVGDHADLVTLLGTADGVVHCTPQGMHDHPGTPFDVALLRPELWVADIVYRPLETELLRAARAVGCATLAGGEMAVRQAIDAFRLITGHEPDPDRMMTHFAELTSAELAATGTAR